MNNVVQRIADNVAAVGQRIADAARRSGRSAAEVTLIAVTKYVGPTEVSALLEAGCRELGESRPQELWRKTEAIKKEGVHWHLIGHLQRNKVRRTLPSVTLIHSCDSLRLLAEIDRVAGEAGIRVPVLLESNISGDSEKHGFAPQEIEGILPEIGELHNVQLRGLMAMASLDGDFAVARQDFARLRELRDRLRENCPETISLAELSMGMSRDFEIAIEEGATMVRVGSALFEGVAR